MPDSKNAAPATGRRDFVQGSQSRAERTGFSPASPEPCRGSPGAGRLHGCHAREGHQSLSRKTEGKGNQLFQPRMGKGVKVYDLTCEEIQWEVEPGRRAKAWAYDGAHGYTLNGKGFPATEPLVCKQGQTARIRFMNEGMMIHPMHLHGMHMTVIAKDGWDQPAPWKCDTLNIAPGERWDVLVKATNPGT